MDISLPVSDSSAAGAFSTGASSRPAASGKFSQTLSKQMSGQHETGAASGQASSTQQAAQARQHAAAEDRSETARSEMETTAKDHAGKNSAEAATTDHVARSGKAGKQAPEEAPEAPPVASGSTPVPAILPEDKALPGGLNLHSGDTPADASEKTVVPAALDKAPSPATNSVLTAGSSSPALLRSNAAHNEIFNSVRTQGTAPGTTNVLSYADSLVTGKSLLQGGKHLPGGKVEKAEVQLNSFLPAGAQDWKFTADALVTAVSDKAAKFEALTMQFDSQAAETFSLINTGSGKSLLTPQAGLKSELTGPATQLAAEFLAGSEEWCQDFGTKIEWLTKENITRAELSLHPAELGALDITISTEDDRISINIVTHTEKSREMLESSLPRLTELLKSQGLALENSNISHNSSPDKQNAQPQQANSFDGSPEEKQTADLGIVRSAIIRHQGQIDHYV